MRLIDLFKDVLHSTGDLFPGLFDPWLTRARDLLQATEEFSECGYDFEIVKEPGGTQIYKIHDGFKVPKGAKIYSICTTPLVIEPNKLITDGQSGITPTFVNKNYQPTKTIVLTYNVIEDKKEEDTIAELHKKLDKIIRNPTEHALGTRGILIRMSVPE